MDTRENTSVILEVLLTLFLIGFAVVVLLEAWSIPANAFEPLGAGFAPIAVSIILIGLAVARLAVTLISRSGPPWAGLQKDGGRRRWDCFFVFVLLVMFVWLMSLKLLPFTVTAALFVGLSMAVLFHRWRKLHYYLGIGALLGLVIEVTSSTIFYIDL